MPVWVRGHRDGEPQLDYADTADRAGTALLLTEWNWYRALEPVAVGQVVARKRVRDGRNALARSARAGWSYRALGRRVG